MQILFNFEIINVIFENIRGDFFHPTIMIIVVSLFLLSLFLQISFKFCFQNGSTMRNFPPTVTILELMRNRASLVVFSLRGGRLWG